MQGASGPSSPELPPQAVANSPGSMRGPGLVNAGGSSGQQALVVGGKNWWKEKAEVSLSAAKTLAAEGGNSATRLEGVGADVKQQANGYGETAVRAAQTSPSRGDPRNLQEQLWKHAEEAKARVVFPGSFLSLAPPSTPIPAENGASDPLQKAGTGPVPYMFYRSPDGKATVLNAVGAKKEEPPDSPGVLNMQLASPIIPGSMTPKGLRGTELKGVHPMAPDGGSSIHRSSQSPASTAAGHILPILPHSAHGSPGSVAAAAAAAEAAVSMAQAAATAQEAAKAFAAAVSPQGMLPGLPFVRQLVPHPLLLGDKRGRVRQEGAQGSLPELRDSEMEGGEGWAASGSRRPKHVNLRGKRKCPVCKYLIAAAAADCSHCGHMFR